MSVVPMIQCVPRDHKQHRRRGAQDDRRLAHDPIARHHDVYALGRPHLEPPTLLGQCAHLVGPHACRVDHAVRFDLCCLTVLGIADAHAHDAVGVAQKSDHLSRGADHRTVVGGRARDGETVPGVVDDGVVVANAADQRIALQRGSHAERARPGDVLLARYRFGTAHRVVEEDSRGDVRAFPDAMRERVEERQRLDQVWGQEAE